MDWLGVIQWPAMVVTVLATWLVGSTRQGRRNVGFWIFLGSNVLWSVWALHTRSYALLTLQICLAVMNVRGASKSE